MTPQRVKGQKRRAPNRPQAEALDGALVGSLLVDALIGILVGSLVGVLVSGLSRPVGCLVEALIGDLVGALVETLVEALIGAFVGDLSGCMVLVGIFGTIALTTLTMAEARPDDTGHKIGLPGRMSIVPLLSQSTPSGPATPPVAVTSSAN
jgi:uncharacterized membrane protein YeaQ/YmgE (transglycosylase-associated protein family)